MVSLTVKAVNCTRPKIEKTAIELTYRDALLEFFNDPNGAANARKYSYGPVSDWQRANRIANAAATSSLTPTERTMIKWLVTFS